jgi:hypothetical protein
MKVTLKMMRWRVCLKVLPAILILPLSLFGKCPLSSGGKLELLAPAGNLIVETTGVDAVEVEISNRQVVLQEKCEGNLVVVTATSVTGLPDWKIRVPKGVELDLTTKAGSIQVGDTDGRETKLRTSGGKITAGGIKGNALLVATEVQAGNIGGNAELRGGGGKLQVGDVGGNAQFFSTGGDIATGIVKGSVMADTGSGSIAIRESNGDVVVTTQAGDITSNYVRGGFNGTTQSGTIRLDKAGSWVHAYTGVGDIVFRLVPTNLAGDLHVKAEAGLGNITMYLPEKISATIDAIVVKPALTAKGILGNFLPNASATVVSGLRGLIPGRNEPQRLLPGPEESKFVINGGANLIKARTSAGTININKGN